MGVEIKEHAHEQRSSAPWSLRTLDESLKRERQEGNSTFLSHSLHAGVVRSVDLGAQEPVQVAPLSKSIDDDLVGEPIHVQSNRGFWPEMVDIIPHLLPGEYPTSIERYDLQPIQNPLTTEQALRRLAGVESFPEKRIGENGPLNASAATVENTDNKELHLFETLFGRDSLIVGLFLAETHPELARSVCVALAELQGIGVDIQREEEFGKIIHEFRTDDDTRGQELRKRGWDFPYYGSVDATSLFIQLVTKVVEADPSFLEQEVIGKGGRRQTIATALTMATDWLLRKTDDSPDGLVEHRRINPKGIENQVWKDSKDSQSYKDGTLTNPQNFFAPVEVQAYTYDAFLAMAKIYKERDPIYAQILLDKAENLKRQILSKFYIEDERGGYFAMGLERISNGEQEWLQQVDTRTSNMGHLLNSAILESDDEEIVSKREELIRTLQMPEMQSSNGLRTLSSREKRFKPGGYHTGSVWPWDNMWVALGYKRLGYEHLSRTTMRAVYERIMRTGEYPEFMRGDEENDAGRNERRVETYSEFDGFSNTIEQLKQSIQAWTVASARRIEEEMKEWGELPSPTLLEREIIYHEPITLAAD